MAFSVTDVRLQLQEADEKADWEGGLAAMLLGYGGHDMFPEEVQDLILDFEGSLRALEAKLAELSDKVGYTERLNW